MNIGKINFVGDGYKNYQEGNPISDVQLNALISNHKSIITHLDTINNRQFDLFRNKISSDLQNFEGFKTARENKNK